MRDNVVVVDVIEMIYIDGRTGRAVLLTRFIVSSHRIHHRHVKGAHGTTAELVGCLEIELDCLVHKMRASSRGHRSFPQHGHSIDSSATHFGDSSLNVRKTVIVISGMRGQKDMAVAAA